MDNFHGTEPASAPATLPRQMRVERQGDATSPSSRRFPQVRGGICEYCGVLDQNVESKYQYKLCPHYRGLQLQCSYCPAGKDSDDVIYHTNMNVAEHPDKPGTIIAWCDSFECSKKHLEKWSYAS
jgi:hypothetical protein